MVIQRSGLRMWLQRCSRLNDRLLNMLPARGRAGELPKWVVARRLAASLASGGFDELRASLVRIADDIDEVGAFGQKDGCLNAK
jgi:hypothetical protein